jgi:hypothetical protein
MELNDTTVICLTIPRFNKYAQFTIVFICFLSFSEATRRRAFHLVAQAFSSINAEEFAAYLGMPVTEAVKGSSIKHLICRVKVT